VIFSPAKQNVVYVSRSDVNSPLAAWSRHGFELDGAEWPSVEHYYQGMKFEDPTLRELIRGASHPRDAEALAKKNKRRIRRDWKTLKQTVMTRGVYIKCKAHPEAAEALLATGDKDLVENSQYDYYWGCGRDGRGENAYGKVLMRVRDRLREEAGGAGG
jgi:ribA/ribD-fused uncharacterized protein